MICVKTELYRYAAIHSLLLIHGDLLLALACALLCRTSQYSASERQKFTKNSPKTTNRSQKFTKMAYFASKSTELVCAMLVGPSILLGIRLELACGVRW